MLMMCPPWFKAVESRLAEGESARVIMTSPAGRKFDQKAAEELSKAEHIVFMAAATANESFSGCGTLEAPQYTHPADFRGMKVPGILLSGDHAKIEAWRKAKALELTRERRPDILDLR